MTDKELHKARLVLARRKAEFPKKYARTIKIVMKKTKMSEDQVVRCWAEYLAKTGDYSEEAMLQ